MKSNNILLILLRANSFSEAFVEGVIKFIVLSLLFFAGSAIYKSLSKRKRANEKDSGSKTKIEVGEILSEKNIDNIVIPQKTNSIVINKKESDGLRFYNYFFSDLNKGYRRLILVGSFLLPLVFGIILYYVSAEERTFDSGETYIDYNDAIPVIVGFILGCLLYWTIFFLVIWILKGFKEDKKPT